MITTAAEASQVPLSPPPREYTPEDLLSMPEGDRYELMDDKLKERDMGAAASEIAGHIVRRAGNHIHDNKLGKYFPTDGGYLIFPHKPKLVRYPDFSFIARNRLPAGDIIPRSYLTIAPDLAVEVVSPKDTAEDIEAKRLDYLRAGVKLVWIVYPETRSVHVYRQAGPPTTLGPDDELTGEDVLSGFVCKVVELFEDS